MSGSGSSVATTAVRGVDGRRVENSSPAWRYFQGSGEDEVVAVAQPPVGPDGSRWARGLSRAVGGRIRLSYTSEMSELLDIDQLDDEDPFEIDDQAAHLFKHAALGIDDVYDVWRSDPLFYPAKRPAHWLMVAEVSGRVLVVPLPPPDSADPRRCRPIGCHDAARQLAERYREDR